MKQVLFIFILLLSGSAMAKPKLDLKKIKNGEDLHHAVEVSAVQSFETLATCCPRFAMKTYNGRNAEILYRTENSVYWGFPNAGFSKLYVRDLFKCNADTFDIISKQFEGFTRWTSERHLEDWFKQNSKVKEDWHRLMILEPTISLTENAGKYQITVKGKCAFYQEEKITRKDNTTETRNKLVAEQMFSGIFLNSSIGSVTLD